jgi:hypothetical protein
MPRPREIAPAPAGVGLAIGAALGGWPGAAIGGLVGGAIGTSAVPLPEALRRKLAEVNLVFEGVRRTSRYEIHVLVREPSGRFWTIVARIAPPEPLQGDALDDALYDAAVIQIDRFRASRGQR